MPFFLPKTDSPMRGNLPVNEPKRLNLIRPQIIQLAIAIEDAQKVGLSDLKQVGVAKGAKRKLGEEVLWSLWNDSSLKPAIHSPALLLMAHIRDETHHFAGEYMHKRKKKNMFTSQLDTIGAAKRALLLKHFGGIDGIKKSSRSQLAQVSGISDVLAERIFKALHR
ncbi:MAG: hypothetical protein COB41_10620 [Proteobacteria bacterium]|nr:MAG: hypothetical protein COB41_10620 [Pseudomonadota bacterium]